MPKRSRKKKTAEKAPEALQILWQEGFFKSWRNQFDIETELTKRGNNFLPDTLRKALFRAPYLISRKRLGSPDYIQKKPAVSEEVDRIETELFDESLVKKFGKSFETELADLQHNFGKSGNCSAFLLRKILEKLIYIAFAKNGLEAKLEDKNVRGRLIGLEAMLNTAVQEKVNGMPFLTSQTAQEIRGIKFLGDASAHNPLAQVDMRTIVPQMPFIITAYKELLSHSN